MNEENQNELQPLFGNGADVLARELALGLGDTRNLKYYQSVVRKYPESVLRELFIRARGFPSHRIKKSKGALFNYLLQKYEKENHSR
ncbi:hypothetical protein A2242_04910 [Candidatus Falkowbacteria bacterium RIFOXYA2_FULL_47_9]|uniref:Uncharacterized protein n=1 Tax=Candidatus Falkowbacteria bacterium RIFOXYA2_FULL_47_9 TaxID=1797995 RepID=A0A1F5SMP8_9BACT|nr:MAG: hypothetical protein A2242_04910 [Candidatus Falkowbacteria bacterium RIFOXYA2_FULL_47_9]OGS24553.1 MAG: hypothetical protein A2314_07045 [Elusimicrobia bacterium RIFOXYB2_FULL_50_12]